MDSLPTRRRFRARWVFPVVGPPLPDGVVTIAGDRILAVEAAPTRAAAATAATIEDLGDVALLPGWINAHTHLELSDFRSPLAVPGTPLADWIPLVMAHRQSPRAPAEAILASGIEECRRAGVAAVADIVQSGDAANALSGSPLAGLAMLELIGPSPERAADALRRASQFLQAESSGGDCRRGLSPHAPYTVHGQLLTGAVELAARHRAPLAMHLAESPEEIELLRRGGGPLRALLEAKGAWRDDLIAANSRPLDYLRALAPAPRVLVIHGNYLDDEEIAFLAARPGQFTVVYCPRTHARFGHAAHPLPRLLAAGAAVALGTDSRASNPDLDLLAEMRHVVEHLPAVPPADVLRLGTLSGARALGLDDRLGSLEAGKLATLTIVGLGAPAARDPYERLFARESAVVGVISGAALRG